MDNRFTSWLDWVPVLLAIVLLFIGCGRSNGDAKESPTGYQQDSREAEIHRQMDSIVIAYATKGGFNGIIGYLEESKEPVISIYGGEDDGSGPFSMDDRFHLASLTKLFTGIATIKLMEASGLEVGDTIGYFFPELKPCFRKLTIQQLANHTSGMHDYLSLTNEHNGLTNDDAIELLKPIDTTVFEPGSRWGYTNSGYVLLARIIEKISGQGFGDYLNSQVLVPLKMHNSDIHPISRKVKGYYGDSLNTTFLRTYGDAGLYASAADLLNFYENRELVSKELTQAKRWSSPWKDPEWKYGFGWFFSSDALGEFMTHSGQAEGFQTYVRLYENKGPMLFLLSNRHTSNHRALREELVQCVPRWSKSGKITSRQH